MNKKKMLLIAPINQAIVSVGGGKFASFPPLGLGILASLTPEDKFEMKLVDENIEKFNYDDADIVIISGFSCVASRAYSIAKYYRDRNVPVVMGGIHATMETEEALQYVDTVITGEGESVWNEMLDDYLSGNLKRLYHGKHLPLEHMPFPKRELFSKDYMFGSLVTSRGCPMYCAFCSVTVFNGGEHRQRSIEDVLDELESIPQKYIFFADDNIIGYGKKEDRAIQLFKGMVERKINKQWVGMASINIGFNDEALEWAKKSGCIMLYLGLESEDTEELASMDKNLNKVLDYNKAFKNINDHGLAIFGAFIYAGEDETVESIKRRTDYIINKPISSVQISLMTPLTGTKLFKKLKDENKLIYTNYPEDWSRYNMSELTFQHNNITHEELLDAMEENFKRLYKFNVIYKKFVHTWKVTKSLKIAMISAVYNFVFKRFTRKLIESNRKSLAERRKAERGQATCVK